MRIRAVKAKTFKEAAETIGASSTTVIRRFKGLVQALPPGVKLPKAIAIDEYKADTDTGKYQLIIADAETHQPIDILQPSSRDIEKLFVPIRWKCRNRCNGHECKL